MSKPRMALNMLKFIYGGLTPQRITELKAQCRREVGLPAVLELVVVMLCHCIGCCMFSEHAF